MPADRQNVVIVYPLSEDRKRVLMQFHKSPHDPSYNRYNGLSIYPGPYENIAEAARRALKTAGLLAGRLELRGGVHWSRFDPNDWPLFGHHFLAHTPDDTPFLVEDDHVRRQWVELEALMDRQLPIWPGDTHIFPLLFDQNPLPFHGLMVYHEGLPQEWRVERA